MSFSKPSTLPSSTTVDDIKRKCPVFGEKICPFAKLATEQKGVADKCPAFKNGCPFKECQTVGELQDNLEEMRDKSKGDDVYVQFLRDMHHIAKVKAVDVGSTWPFSQGGCPFAKDTKKKPILSPDYIVTPMGITLNDVILKCPAFDKGKCPYAVLVTKCEGLAGNCPAFKEGCPFKNCKSVGEFVEKLTQMRDVSKGKDAYEKFFKELHAITESEQEKLGVCPINKHVCQFSHDAQGKPIIPK